jgi:transcriptional regulator with XRE-family HTH domain
MGDLMTEAQVEALASRLLLTYLKLCNAARLNRSTQAELVGLTATRLTQLEAGKGSPSLMVFFRMYGLIPRLQLGLEEGWLPAPGTRGKAQSEALARLQAV